MATTKTKSSAAPKTINDLKGANYNPRFITPKQLTALKKSMERFGDLSGVVFNRATGVLVSGHQRMKTIKGKQTKIVRTAQPKDAQGTMAVGFIEVAEVDGSITKVPYREVHWDDKLQEMAANVAANAAGGEFDQAKLGSIMSKLEKGQFDVELTALDNWTTAKAIGKFKKSQVSDDAGSSSAGNTSNDFSVVDPNAMHFEHTCPKCQYQFGEKVKPGTKGKGLTVSLGPAGRPKKTDVKPATKKITKVAKKMRTKR